MIHETRLWFTAQKPKLLDVPLYFHFSNNSNNGINKVTGDKFCPKLSKSGVSSKTLAKY